MGLFRKEQAEVKVEPKPVGKIYEVWVKDEPGIRWTQGTKPPVGDLGYQEIPLQVRRAAR